MEFVIERGFVNAMKVSLATIALLVALKIAQEMEYVWMENVNASQDSQEKSAVLNFHVNKDVMIKGCATSENVFVIQDIKANYVMKV